MDEKTTYLNMAYLKDFKAGLSSDLSKIRLWPQRTVLASEAVTEIGYDGFKLLFCPKKI